MWQSKYWQLQSGHERFGSCDCDVASVIEAHGELCSGGCAQEAHVLELAGPVMYPRIQVYRQFS